MRRATENLEPESSDLVERGMRRGATLRRRRTALLSLSGATAVLATAGVVIGGSQLFAKDARPPVASTTTSQATTKANAPVAKPVTPEESLKTLVKLLPPKLLLEKGGAGADEFGITVTAYVNDGKAISLLSVRVSGPGVYSPCIEPKTDRCVTRPDGSKLSAFENEPVYDKGNNPGGVLFNRLTVQRAGTETVSLTSFNAMAEKESTATRATPALSIAQLTKIADSPIWRFPAKPVAQPSGPAKPNPKDPGAGKPGVPALQTLQTLKKVLPAGLSLSRPESWGGGTEGHNGAAYLVNDGKGLARVDAFVTREMPVTKCTSERSTTFCEVRDGYVVGWEKNSPTYSDARQAKDGVISNRVEIHYPDGRMITMTSYNGPQEKLAKHTRVKPVFTTEQLLAMAANKAWKFPGTGTR
jgi:hypothetical protein